MRELSIEEKVKAYDEAYKKVAVRFGSNVADEIFLKDNEDEKIRKDIIWCLKHSGLKESNPINPHVTTTTKDAIAWLEKQGEQKQVIDYPDSLPKDNWELIHEFVNKFGRIPKDEDELNVLIEYVLKRQKPAWSEEDERIIDNLVSLLGNIYARKLINEETKDKYVNWLKSLIPQPKQGCCECDEIDIQAAIEICENAGYDLIANRLKSLKDRCTWKPSDEQMKQLGYIAKQNKDNMIGKELMSLYQDLKKLREE